MCNCNCCKIKTKAIEDMEDSIVISVLEDTKK